MNPRQLISAALLAMSLLAAPACTDPNPGPGPDPTDPGPTPLPTDPNDPNNAAKDTDCDGLSDKIEFEAVYDGSKTNPGLADTDQDGLPDGLEVGVLKPVTGTSCTITPDADVSMQTSPVRADTDGDGLPDGVEDKNHNGKVDDDEPHPLLLDTDCDGLRDGPSTSSVKGEDQNANGTREANETDPRLFDTDGDGISDGVESGATTNLDEANCKDIFRADVNPSTTTDPTNPDSDGDGVSDGAEDTNQNGGLDQGELDPRTSDASGPAGQVCTANNLRPVSFQSEEGPDIKLALPPTFTEVTQIKSGTDVKGLVGYDSTSKIAFLAFRTTPPASSTTALGDEEELQPAIASKGTLTNRTHQVFKTWEGFEAVQVFYDQAGSTTDLKRRTDELVDALVPGSTGRLSSAAAGVTGNFRLQTLFVHRSNQSLVVVIAIAPLAGVTGGNRNTPAAFSVKDLSDGSALAQFGEPTAVQCERFQLPISKVDFLFVVDDSGSMKTSQLSLAAAAQSAADSLNASSLDWRMAMVTSAYHLGTAGNGGKLRRFTRNVSKVKSWLTENSTCSGTSNGTCSLPAAPESAPCPGDTSEGVNGGCWVGLGGNGSEGVLGAARKAIDDMTPGTEPTASESATLTRKDATIVVVLLGDADDQSTGYTTVSANCGAGGSKDKAGSDCVSIQTFAEFFGTRSEVVAPKNKTGRQIPVHGIVCPAGQACGCDAGKTCNLSETSREFNPLPANGGQRHAAVVNATGGVLGSILDTASIGASVDAIIADAIGNAGYKTLKPPIGASIKVAMENVRDAAVCTASGNIPRSTVNGFDFDGSARTLSFFGACRPASESTQVAVSYQYWVDAVKDPNGGIACEDDPNYNPTEPDHCTGPLLGCNESGTQCVCKPNCGDSCGSGARCDMTSCSCKPILN
ncbi:adventurous gliding motility lipoprotein CglD [Archangium lansingense]|uniref:adventurous gliding motility lipoprotein CglD n=1 Tax=Archangium lansingense TaxID=2995310 RepID=UPI003B7F23D4